MSDQRGNDGKIKLEETNKEFCISLPEGQSIEVKYKNLSKIIEMRQCGEENIINELEAHCPSSVAEFIEIFTNRNTHDSEFGG